MKAILSVEIRVDNGVVLPLLHEQVRMGVPEAEGRSEGLRQVELLQLLVNQMRESLDLRYPE